MTDRPGPTRWGRRRFLAGAAGAAASLAACGGSEDDASSPATATGAPATAPAPEMPLAVTAVAPTEAGLASPPVDVAAGGLVIEDSPILAGHALVTSVRLPLFGIGASQVALVLGRDVADWAAVGSGVSLPVSPIGFAGVEQPGLTATTEVDDYAALVAAFDADPGAVSVIPLETVDYRVNVLAIDGVDPLRGPAAARPTVRIGIAGDIVPGRNVYLTMARYGDFLYPFRDVAAELASYDFTVANLEGNISDTLAQPDNPNAADFVSPSAMLEGFQMAGIDAVSLANNHTAFNGQGWGTRGLLDTMDALAAAGIPYVGAGRDLAGARAPLLAEVGGKTVAILGVDGVTANEEIQDVNLGIVLGSVGAGPDSPGTNPFVTAQMVEDIAAAADRYDIVIPYLHMGVQYVWTPPDWVVAAARAAVDAGATMVVTNHPHVSQCMETYAGRPIVYSVGNFIFDQMFSVETRQGLILEITLDGTTVVGIRFRGVEIEDFCRPRLMTGGEQATIMDRFWRNTDRLAARGR